MLPALGLSANVHCDELDFVPVSKLDAPDAADEREVTVECEGDASSRASLLGLGDESLDGADREVESDEGGVEVPIAEGGVEMPIAAGASRSLQSLFPLALS